jgi:hypothetical protein
MEDRQIEIKKARKLMEWIALKLQNLWYRSI